MTKFEKISIFVGLSAFLVSAIGGGYTYYLNNMPTVQHLTVLPIEFELRYGDNRHYEYTASVTFFNRGDVELILNSFSTHMSAPYDSDGQIGKGWRMIHAVEWGNPTVILNAGESKTVKYETSGKLSQYEVDIFLSKSKELESFVKFKYSVLSLGGGAANNVVQMRTIFGDNSIRLYSYQSPQNEIFDGPAPPAPGVLLQVE